MNESPETLSGEAGRLLGAAPCYAFLWANGGWDKKNWKQFDMIAIPWDMVAPHDAQAKANHYGQDLAKLQSRAGVSYCEALAILDDRPWRAMDENEAHDELKRRVDAYTHNEKLTDGGPKTL